MDSNNIEQTEIIDVDAEQVQAIEISPQLIGFIADDEAEQDGEKSEQPKHSKSDLDKAASIAKGTLKAAEKAVEFWFKCNTGLSEDDRKEWAEKVAPVLVEAGIKDYFGVLDKYGIYITAIIATGQLGMKIAGNVGQQLAEKEQEEAQVIEQEQSEKSGAPVASYQQDFKGRGGFVSEVQPE